MACVTNHQSRGVAEIAADGGKVKGRHCRDEAIHAAISNRVASLLIRRNGLILEAFLHKIRMHLKEIDQLCRTVDLRLDHGLTLTEHSGGVQLLSVLGCHEIRYPQPHLQPLLDRLFLPFPLRFDRDVNRLLHQIRRRPIILGDLLLVIVRLKNSRISRVPNSIPISDVDTIPPSISV